MPESIEQQDSQGKKIVKGCLLALLFLSLLVVGSCLLFFKNKDSLLGNLEENAAQTINDMFNVPYYGKREYITTHYGEILDTIEVAARANNSPFSFAATIEHMPLPGELVYFVIEHSGSQTKVINKLEWSSHATMVSQGYGAGKLYTDEEKVPVMIYKHSGPWPYMDSYTLYIVHDAGEPVPDSF